VGKAVTSRATLALKSSSMIPSGSSAHNFYPPGFRYRQRQKEKQKSHRRVAAAHPDPGGRGAADHRLACLLLHVTNILYRTSLSLMHLSSLVRPILNNADIFPGCLTIQQPVTTGNMGWQGCVIT
jgi:hypothetical protein